MVAWRRGLAAGVSAAALLAGGAAAQAQGWNMYGSFTDSVQLNFATPIGVGAPPTMTISVGGGQRVATIVDTGSTGLAISQNLVNLGNAQPIGGGSIPYTSSGNGFQGTYYSLPVTMFSNGSASYATAQNVQVLVLNNNDSQIYMGVGFDRGGNPSPPIQNVPLYPALSMNPFLNITSINGTPVSNMRRGYVVNTSGVTLGLTGQTTGFALMKLAPNSVATGGGPDGNPSPWSRAQAGVTVNGVAAGTGNFVPDTGIRYMILVPSQSLTSGLNCTTNACVQSQVNNGSVQVNLTPGLPTNATSYGFSLTGGVVNSGGTGSPAYVSVEAGPAGNPLDSQPSSNSGQGFYTNFQYLLDFDGGYVGYAAANSSVTVIPVLGLQGSVSLPNSFATTLPTYLTANATLLPAGQVSFNSIFMGLGNSLTITGGGSATFNGPVDMGGGAFTVAQGGAVINASLAASTITVGAQGTLSGSGLIMGNVVHGGTIAPGNSIGTMNIIGSYTQMAGSTYQAEVNAAGQGDRINVLGTASIQGGAVNVVAAPGGTFSPSTTYTILSATGGVSGTFASVNELYPFLLSDLSYDANNAYLTLQIGGFAAAAANPTQMAVGTVLDANVGNATGDFATVLGAMAFNTQSNAQAQATLQAISGNNYAGFSTSMVQGMQLFMNNFANQTGGGGSPMNNRVALAEACDVACDATTPPKWGAWGGALGGLGTVGVNQPVGSVTYNAGGFAAGLDRAITDAFRVGLTSGFTTGTQWVGGYDGLGRTDTFQVGLYGGFAQDKVYADAVIGYAYSWNQMWRNIPVPGLPTRTAQGRTGANQFYGQVETGYRFDLGTTANAFVTPFARLQAYTGTQNAFTETGAQSLNLTVAQQTTNSLRSVIGAQLGGSMDLGWREKLAMQLRLGWSHEYADVGRPVTATLAGAPAMPFTTFGVSPQRDGVVLGLSANTAIAEATSVYFRYEGDISGQDSAHAVTAGVRLTW